MNEKELYDKGKFLHKTEKNYEKAMEIYEQIIKDYPDTEEAYYSEFIIKEIEQDGFNREKFERMKKEKEIIEKINNIIITTTNNIDGYSVKKYIDIESVEIVIGTGLFSEFTTSIQDFLGQRSTAFEGKLKEAKQFAMNKLKEESYNKGGNAIIGIAINYTEFDGNRIGLIINGTIVEIEENKFK